MTLPKKTGIPAAITSRIPTPTLAKLDIGRTNNMNVLRLGASVAVVYAHAFNLRNQSDPFEPVLGLSTGSLAVAIFFSLSGFLVSKSLVTRNSLLEFSIARALRIIPALWVANLITVIIAGFFLTSITATEFFRDPLTWDYLLSNNLLYRIQFELPGVFLENPYPRAVNGSLWTLKWELVMYALVFAAGSASLLAGKFISFGISPEKILGYAFSGLLIATTIILFANRPRESEVKILLISCFASGSLCFVFRRSLRLTGGGACAALLISGLTAREAALTPILAASISYLLLWLSFNPWIKIHAFGTHTDLSYGVYIYAFPVQQAIYSISPPTDPLVNLSLTILVVVPLAFASWHIVEKKAIFAKVVVVKNARIILDAAHLKLAAALSTRTP